MANFSACAPRLCGAARCIARGARAAAFSSRCTRPRWVSSFALGNSGGPSNLGGNSLLSRRTMTASSCARSGVAPRAKRWSSSSSSRAEKLSG